MRSLRTLGAFVACGALVSACNGALGSDTTYRPGTPGTPTPTPSPTPFSSACPTPSGQLIAATPNPLTVHVGQNQTLTICEAAYVGSFSVTSNSQSCVVTPLTVYTTWNVYGSFAGTCVLTITDKYGNTLQVPATVG